MVEVSSFVPGIIRQGQTTNGGRKVYVDISLEVSAKGVDGKKDTGQKSFALSPLFHDICCNEGNKVHQVAVKPEEVPEFRGHGKGNMLPDGSGEDVKTVFNPDVSSLLSAGRTESGFAAMRDFDAL